MPPQNIYPEFIFAVAIWLTAIFIFVVMLFAMFASHVTKYGTQIKSRLESRLKFSLMIAIFTNCLPKKKSKSNLPRTPLKSA